MGVGLIRDEVSEEACCFVTVKSEASKVTRNADAIRRMLVAFSVPNEFVLFRESATMWWRKVDGRIVKGDKSVV